MPHQYMYSPSTPTYSPSYRPAYASYAARSSASKGKNLMCYGCGIVGFLVLALAIWYTRIIMDPVYAQSQMYDYPDLVPFLNTMPGKLVTVVLYIVAISLFTGGYKHLINKK
jgi:hypothetical protein